MIFFSFHFVSSIRFFFIVLFLFCFLFCYDMFNQVVGIDIRLLPLKIMFRITEFILIQLYADETSESRSVSNEYTSSTLSRLCRDGAKVKGYYAWSLVDNWEWQQGYTERFGMHYVNFTDPARPRYPKASARWWKFFLDS